jgi:molybdenum cofactor cytidylyltransferase
MAARQLQLATDKILAVVSPQSTQLSTWLLQEHITVIECPQAIHGMGASIACGVTASSSAQAWVIALADMPFIQMTTLQQLVTLLRQGEIIVAPQYRGKRGHPVGFNYRWYPELSQLQGELGARSLLQRHADQITLFPCDDAGIHQDIDSKLDLIPIDLNLISRR